MMSPLHVLKLKIISILNEGLGWENSSVDIYQAPTICQAEMHESRYTS